MKKKSVIFSSIIILALLIFLIISAIINKRIETKPVIKHENIIEEINKEDATITYEEQLNELRNEYNNNDLVGTLSIENTSFNEIVMQYTDNDYYLTHTVYHKEDWRGQTFLDYRVDINDSKKLIIYGHNSPNYHLPFEIFENYYDSNYIKEHRYLYLQTDKGINIYEIFSVYIEVNDWGYYNKMHFINDEDYYNHILNFKNRSFYDTGVEVNKDDDILIIQTCSTHNSYNEYENKFLLVIGKKV